jgi:hypothetical protein
MYKRYNRNNARNRVAPLVGFKIFTYARQTLAHWLAVIPCHPVRITSALVCQNSRTGSRAIGGRFSLQVDGSYEEAVSKNLKLKHFSNFT